MVDHPIPCKNWPWQLYWHLSTPLNIWQHLQTANRSVPILRALELLRTDAFQLLQVWDALHFATDWHAACKISAMTIEAVTWCMSSEHLRTTWDLEGRLPVISYRIWMHMGVSINGGTPKSSILMGFSIINHPFWRTPVSWCFWAPELSSG